MSEVTWAQHEVSSSRRFSLSDEPFLFGFCVSLALHALLLYFVIFNLVPSFHDFGPPKVYSVTIEGGEVLGGKSQVPTNKVQKPPPRSATSETTKPEVKSEAKPDPKLEQKVESKTDAEVSLAERKPTPAPTSKPTAKPTSTPVSKATPKPQPTKKPAAVSDPNQDYNKLMQRYLGESAKAGGKNFGAAALGGKGMGGGTLETAEFIAYYNLLTSHIKKGWRWIDNSTPYLAKVSFVLEADGRIHSIELVQSSGSREFDDSVMRAIAKANPAPPPPSSVYARFRNSVMRFDPREL